MVHKKKLIAEDENYIVHRNGNRVEVTDKTDGKSFSVEVPEKKKSKRKEKET